jgi:hypothetical protein
VRIASMMSGAIRVRRRYGSIGIVDLLGLREFCRGGVLPALKHLPPAVRADDGLAPAPTMVPDTLHDVDFIERDSKRFPDTGGWGYAQFNYDAASDTFTPDGSGSDCGHACHTIVAAKDYIFTAYPRR